jgi:hypothetical protein
MARADALQAHVAEFANKSLDKGASDVEFVVSTNGGLAGYGILDNASNSGLIDLPNGEKARFYIMADYHDPSVSDYASNVILYSLGGKKLMGVECLYWEEKNHRWKQSSLVAMDASPHPTGQGVEQRAGGK